MNRKDDFVKAYVAMYGTTKKNALQVYSEAHPDYISAIVYAWKRNAQRAFYED